MIKNRWYPILAGLLILILVSSSCRALTWSSRNKASPTGQSQLPSVTATSINPVGGPAIPITGENVMFMQCQFCVAEETHVVLIFPDTAYFDVSQPSVTCLTADVVDGKRILICHGPQSTSFNLSICSDPSNCLQFPVALQPCALLQGSSPISPPVILVPLDKKKNAGRGPAQPASPPRQVAVPTAPPIESTKPPEPPKEPKPTNEPRPTKEPKPTHEPKPTKNKP